VLPSLAIVLLLRNCDRCLKNTVRRSKLNKWEIFIWNWIFPFLTSVLFFYLVRNSFSDELPSRFRKQIIREIEEPDHQTIHLDNLNRVLANIGRQDAFLSNEEMETLLQDAGCDTHQRYLPIDKMVELM
jgi:hypothetical protein